MGRVLVAGQGVGAAAQAGAAAAGRRRLDQVDFLAFARLGAEGGERLRVRRPRQHPVLEALLAVLAELHLLAVGAHEDVALLDEGGRLAVGGAARSFGGALALGDELLGLRGGGEPVGPRRLEPDEFLVGTVGGGRGEGRARPGFGTLVGGEVALPVRAADREAERLAVVDELDAVEGEAVGLVFLARRLRQGGCELGVVEGGGAGAALGVDEDELAGAAAQVVAIPEAGVVGEPAGRDFGLVDAAGLAGPPRALLRLRKVLRRGDEPLQGGGAVLGRRIGRAGRGGPREGREAQAQQGQRDRPSG